MKAYGEWMYNPHFLDHSTSWRWVVSFTTPAALPLDRIGGWVDPRAGLDDVKKRNLTVPGLVQPVASRYTDWAIPARRRNSSRSNWMVWHSGIIPELYWAGDRFEFRLIHRLSSFEVFHVFSHSFQESDGIVFWLCQHSFLPNPLKFNNRTTFKL
jgi:hypothetical protein